jgi:hypothetical protein
VSCEGHQKDKRERLCRYIARVYRPPRCRHPPSIIQFHRQGSLYPGDTLPRRDNPGGL